jgi:Holliday junction resolvase RusA-like endonuclease
LDALQALASRRRELPLNIVTERPLRKMKKTPRGVRESLRRVVLRQIESQMRERRRRAFRGRVAVDLELRLPRGRYEAGMGPVVKGYLDVLTGSVYSDDAVVDHLTVSCSYAPGVATVKVRCQPIGLFAASFDRSFRVASELRLPSSGGHSPTLPWGLKGFDRDEEESLRYEEGVLSEVERLDAEEEQAFEEDEDADFYPEVYDKELSDPQLRESLGPQAGRKHRLRDWPVADRPGIRFA